MKQLWMLVGGNGAGKTTFYEQLLKSKGLPFINADIIAREVFPEDPESNSRKAAQIAEQLRFQKLREGHSFCFETVFSHPSKVDFIATAKALGYSIILIVIHIDADMVNIARVHQRVHEGGHSVPTEKIISRIPRTLNNVKKAIPLCDEVHFFDNSRLDTPFRRILSIKDSNIEGISRGTLPTWIKNCLSMS